MAEKDAELRKALVALFMVFKDRPNMLINYLLHYNVLKKDFRERIKTNEFLRDISQDLHQQKDIDKPYFLTLEQMQQYYNQAFYRSRETTEPTALGVISGQEAMQIQLREAVNEENFERAAQIKKYMDEIGRSSEIN